MQAAADEASWAALCLLPAAAVQHHGLCTCCVYPVRVAMCCVVLCCAYRMAL